MGSEETEFIRGLDAEVHPVRFCDIGGFLMRGLRPLSKKPYVILPAVATTDAASANAARSRARPMSSGVAE